MAAAAAPSEVIRTMGALFRPTTRYRDFHNDEYYGQDELPDRLTEVELLPHLTLEDVLATGITWTVLCRFLGRDKAIWMTRDVFVCSGNFVRDALDVDYWLDRKYLALGGVEDADTKLSVHATWDTPAAATRATCDFLLRLLATCEQHGVYIGTRDTITVALCFYIRRSSISIFQREPKLSSKSVLSRNDLERRPVPCTHDNTTT
jgi:hypothetical protein